MALVGNHIFSGTVSGGTLTTLYTVPSNTTTFINKLLLSNYNASASNVQVNINSSVTFEIQLAAYGYVDIGGFYIEAGEILKAVSTTGAAILCSGIELT